MKSSIPYVTFRQNSFASEVRWSWFFLFQDSWGWGKRLVKWYPRFRGIDQIQDQKERVRVLKREVRYYRSKYRFRLQSAQQQDAKLWRRIERQGLTELSNIIGTSWSTNRRITAYLSLNSICPRFLDTWSFMVFFRSSPKDAMETILHECSHFLFFKKWHEVFTKTPRRHFDAPHLVWHFSEISAPVILNDPRLQRVNPRHAMGYREHARIKIGGKTAPRVFAALYRQCMRDGSGFEGYMKKGIALVRKTKSRWK